MNQQTFYKTNKKRTESQKTRDLIFRLWEVSNQKMTFEDFYLSKMKEIQDSLSQEIDDQKWEGVA